MNDMRRYSREFMTEFIELYKSLPSLWLVKSKEYSNRDIKARDYEALIQKWREVEHTADREFVVKKINSIRSVYRRERKRVLKAGGDESFTSSLWYYPLLSFLEDQEPPKPSMFHFKSEEYKQPLEFVKIENAYATPTPSPSPSNISTSTVRTNPDRKRRPSSNTNETVNEIQTQLKKPIGDDKYDHTAKSWAATLRDLPQQQQIFATKLINDVLYEAQLNTLSRESITSVTAALSSLANNPGSNT